MSSIYHIFNGNVLLLLTICHKEFQVCMAVQWTTWTKHVMGQPWYTIKTTNIQINFGLSFWHFFYTSHFRSHNDYCNYMHCNWGVRNNTEWVGWIPFPFVVGNVVLTRSIIKCKICHSTHVCIALCHAQIVYIYSTSIGMSIICVHLDVHDHLVANSTCRKSLGMAHHSVASEIFKTPTTKNSDIIIATSKQFFTDYFQKPLTSSANHHLVGLSLKLVIDKFNTLSSPYYRSFVYGSKCSFA